MICRYITTAIVFAALAACSSSQQRALDRASAAAERTLQRIPTIGDPGRVAAADIAFARMARDQGQWTAFREYAAPNAHIHGQEGLLPAAQWLDGREDPEQSVAWTPNTIWASCDGTLSVTFGRFQQPTGEVGSYVTVWDLQGDRSYKWSYDMGGLDNPQPVPEPDEEIPEGAIIVPGMTAINGMVADCVGEGDALTINLPEITDGAETGGRSSRDRTLEYRWEHGPDGRRRVIVEWWRDGEWQTAVDFTAPPPLEG